MCRALVLRYQLLDVLNLTQNRIQVEDKIILKFNIPFLLMHAIETCA